MVVMVMVVVDVMVCGWFCCKVDVIVMGGVVRMGGCCGRGDGADCCC